MLGCVCQWPRLRLCPQGRLRFWWNTSGVCITRLNIWIQSTSSLTHHQPVRMSTISKWLQALALGGLSSHPLLGSKSWVGHELEEMPICSLRMKVGPGNLLPYSAYQPSFLLPLFLLLLVTFVPTDPPTYRHFKTSRMYPRRGHF